MASQKRVQAGMKETKMDPLRRILSISFCRIRNRPKTWWFKTITTYLAFDSVDWQFGLGSAAPLRGSLGLSWGPSCVWSAGGWLTHGYHSSAMMMRTQGDSVLPQNKTYLGWALSHGLWPILKRWSLKSAPVSLLVLGPHH